MGNEVKIITNKAGHKVEIKTNSEGARVAKEYDKNGQILKQSIFEKPRTDAGPGGFASSQSTTTTLAKDGKLDNSIRYTTVKTSVLAKPETIIENDNTHTRTYHGIGKDGKESMTEKM